MFKCDLHFDLKVNIYFFFKVYESKAKLRIGYYYGDAVVNPDPAVNRAMTETKLALEKMGHTVSGLSVDL